VRSLRTQRGSVPDACREFNSFLLPVGGDDIETLLLNPLEHLPAANGAFLERQFRSSVSDTKRRFRGVSNVTPPQLGIEPEAENGP